MQNPTALTPKQKAFMEYMGYTTPPGFTQAHFEQWIDNLGSEIPDKDFVQFDERRRAWPEVRGSLYPELYPDPHQPSSAPPTPPQIYVQSQGKTWGPYQPHELAAHVAAGRFSATDLANIAGSPHWQPLSTLVSIQAPAEKKSSAATLCLTACLLGTVIAIGCASTSPAAAAFFGIISLAGFLGYAAARMF